MSIDLKELPPPGVGDTFGTLKMRKKTVSTTGPGRPSKGLKQLNLKLSAATRSKLIEICDRAINSKKHATRSDVIAEMVDVYTRHGAGYEKPTPSPRDRSDKRTQAETVFFNPGLFEQLVKFSADRGMTMSGFLHRLVMQGLDHSKLATEVDQQRARIAELEAELKELRS